MKYCSKCGQEINDEAVICVHCGCAVVGANKARPEADAPSAGWSILAWFLPVIGLILYFVWKDDKPLQAESVLCGLFAVLGCFFPVGIALFFIYKTKNPARAKWAGIPAFVIGGIWLLLFLSGIILRSLPL